MKIGIITFQFVDNYGAVLQAYALKRYLSEKGNEVSIVNYDNHTRRTAKRNKISRLKSKIWGIIKTIIFGREKHKRFSSFRKDYLELSDEVILNRNQLEDFLNTSNYDCIIVGSDQVWNPLITSYDETYLLDLVPTNCLKVAYAASFGLEKLNSKWMNSVVLKLIDFSGVSVREETAQRILIDAGYTGNVQVVTDPVFLLEKEKWEEVASIRLQEKYILCYVMPGDRNVEKRIEKMAKTLGKRWNYKIIYIGRKEYKKMFNDGKDILNASPTDFLGYFIGAELILTNSFHGTAFSIIFKKNFYSFVNLDLDGKKQLASRITDLLKECNLESRCISNDEMNEDIVSYEFSNDKLDLFINNSKLFLDCMLNK